VTINYQAPSMYASAKAPRPKSWDHKLKINTGVKYKVALAINY